MTSTRRILIILAFFPRLASVTFGSSKTFFIGLPILVYPFILFKKNNNALLTIPVILTAIIFSETFNIFSIFYYTLGILFLCTSIAIRHLDLKKIYTVVLVLFSIFITLDFVNVSIIESVISYHRVIDQRTSLGLIRPVGFSRENSEMGMALSAIYFGTTAINERRLANFSLLLLIISQSLMGLLSLLFIVLTSRKSAKTLLFLALIGVAILVLYLDRITIIFNYVTAMPFHSLVELNTSFIKRIIHPLVAFTVIWEDYDFFQRVFGCGPGNLRPLVIENFSYLKFSDLKTGYILNGPLVIILTFGLFGFIIFAIVLFYVHGTRRSIIILFIFSNGVPILSPIFIPFILKEKKYFEVGNQRVVN